MGDELEQVSKTTEMIIAFLIENGAKIASAIIVLAVGFYIAKWLHGFLMRRFVKRGTDITLAKFIAGLVKLLILTMAFLFAFAKFYNIAPLVAMIGAGAFGASLAFQAPISNYGAGLMIILTRPFVVGNTLTVQDQYGQVKDISLAYTQLENEDGEIITIPNKQIMGEIFVNSQENRIIEGVIGISYDSDPDKAIAAILEAMKGIAEVDDETPSQAGIEEFADSSVNIAYRCWVPTKIYHATRFKVNRAVYAAVKGCADIPFPQLDVKVKKS